MSKPSLASQFRNKTGKCTDKWESYLRIYDKTFCEFREDPIHLLEIGVQNGGSLEVWAQYFDHAESIIGCDIDPKCCNLCYEDARISVVIADPTTESGLKKIASKSSFFDIVIDDGSHISSDIINAFFNLFPLLRPGGVYIVEDLHCSYWIEFEGGLNHPASAIAFFKSVVDYINRSHLGVPLELQHLFGSFTDTPDSLLNTLDGIQYIQFFDSVCIIHKASPALLGLGDRVTVGSESYVAEVVSKESGLSLTVPDQTDNPYVAKAELAVHQDFLLKNSAAELHESRKVIERLSRALVESQEAGLITETTLRAELKASRIAELELYRSLSWRITAPARLIVDYVATIKALFLFSLEVVGLILGKESLPVSVLKTFREEGFNGISKELSAAWNRRRGGQNEYAVWVKLFDSIDEQARSEMSEELTRLGELPLISILMPVYNPSPSVLERAIQSARAQIYPHWELCIADDASTDPAVRALIEAQAAEDKRILFNFRDQNGHISAASNTALSLAHGDFIALLDHDDLLAESALYWVAKAINQTPDAQLIYSDEDKLDKDGLRKEPYFKSEYNPELMLAQNMISHLGVYRRELVISLGGFREGYEGAQDYDLALRVLEKVPGNQVVHIPRILYHWRAVAGSAAAGSNEKPYAVEAARRAVASHLKRQAIDAVVSASPDVPHFNRVRYALPGPPARVSIIIPTRDQAEILHHCITSILCKSTWSNYEIIVVDNGSEDAATFELLSDLRTKGIKVLTDDSPFNFSALNNQAVEAATGDVLCLLNNDIEILTADWLEELLRFALRPDVGCVGAKLWYPNGTIQHAGVVLGIGGVAGHAYKSLDRGEAGHSGRAVLHQEVSAVTGACLMVRKETYLAVGGFEENLPVAFNDIDFCLKVRELGLRNIYTPYAECLHHESLSRGDDQSTLEKRERFHFATTFMLEKWGHCLSCDPAYNPNLTMTKVDFSLAWPPRSREARAAAS